MKKSCIIVNFVVLLLLIHIVCALEQFERDSLMDLFMSTGGKTWKNNTGWGLGEPCLIYWYGVDCFENNTVTFL